MILRIRMVLALEFVVPALEFVVKFSFQILPQPQPQRRAAMRLEGRGPWMQIAAELACCYYSTSVHNRAGEELAKFAGQTSTGHPHVC